MGCLSGCAVQHLYHFIAVQGMTQKETAEFLEVSVSTLKRRMKELGINSKSLREEYHHALFRSLLDGDLTIDVIANYLGVTSKQARSLGDKLGYIL